MEGKRGNLVWERAASGAASHSTNEISPWNEGVAERVVEKKETGERQSFLPHGNAMGECAGTSRVTSEGYSEFGGKKAE